MHESESAGRDQSPPPPALFLLPPLLDFPLLYIYTSLRRRYEELAEDRDLQGVVERAFGRGGLGIAVVVGVPDIAQLRRELFAAGQRYIYY